MRILALSLAASIPLATASARILPRALPAETLYSAADARVQELRMRFAEASYPSIEFLALGHAWSCLEYRWEPGGYYVAAIDSPSFQFYEGADAINHRYFNQASDPSKRYLFVDQGFLSSFPDGLEAGRFSIARAASDGTTLLVEHSRLPWIARAQALKSAVDPRLDIVGYSVCSPSQVLNAANPKPASKPTPAANTSLQLEAPNVLDAQADLDSTDYLGAISEWLASDIALSATIERVGTLTAAQRNSRILDEVQTSCLLSQVELFSRVDKDLPDSQETPDSENPHLRGSASVVKNLLELDLAARKSATPTRPVLRIRLVDYREGTLPARLSQPWIDVSVPKCAKTPLRLTLRVVIDPSGECRAVSQTEIHDEIETQSEKIKRPYSKLRACQEP